MSLNKPDYQIKTTLRKTLVKMVKDKKDTSKIFRCFLLSVYEQTFLANNNAETLSIDQPLALNAFAGN